MSIRKLSPELQELAILELNENPLTLEEDLKHIKEWIKEQPNIHDKNDDQWLISFLRGCKFNMQKTKDKLEAYYNLRNTLPIVFQKRDPFCPEVQRVLDRGIIIPLPKTNDPTEKRTLLLRTDFDASTMQPKELFTTFFMFLDIFMNEDDNFMVSGVNLVLDMYDITFRHFFISPMFFQKMINCLQKNYPVRIKNILGIHINFIFDIGFKTLRPLVPSKFLNRLILYKTKNVENMYDIVPIQNLPKEYGGNAGTLNEISAIWKSKVESYAGWFEKMENSAVSMGKYEVVPDI